MEDFFNEYWNLIVTKTSLELAFWKKYWWVWVILALVLLYISEKLRES